MKNTTLIVLAAVAGSLSTTQAAIIAGYDFGTTTTPSTAVTTKDAGVTASNVVGSGTASGSSWGTAAVGDTTGIAASGTTFGSTTLSSFGSTNSGLSTNSLANAVTANDYIGFTITATTAGTLNISGFSVDTAKAGGTGTQRPAADFNILAAVNGGTFTTANALTTDKVTAGEQAATTWDSLFLDLSGNTAFQGINSVEFRIYVWGGGSATSSSRMNFDQILVEGSVIPEPSSFALLGLGMAGLLLRRRRG